MKTKMKMMAGTTGIMVLLVTGFFLFSAFRSAVNNEKLKLAMEVRTYLDKNVKPVMQPQRTKLDQYLTQEEKKQVAALNARLRQLIKNRNQQGVGFLTSEEFSFSSVPAYSKEQKAAQKAARDEMRRIMAEAWAIADKHEQQIGLLMNEKSFYFGTWKRDITAMVQEYLDDKFLFIGSKQIVKRFENRETIRYFSPVAFLLWDPSQRFVSDELLNSK